MPTPTDDQLRQYAAKLPAIYRHILAAFPETAPNRQEGDALSGSSIQDYVTEADPSYRLRDVLEAVVQLASHGFLAPDTGVAFSPTPLGERLISVLTGHQPEPHKIPDLPVPTWG